MMGWIALQIVLPAPSDALFIAEWRPPARAGLNAVRLKSWPVPRRRESREFCKAALGPAFAGATAFLKRTALGQTSPLVVSSRGGLAPVESWGGIASKEVGMKGRWIAN